MTVSDERLTEARKALEPYEKWVANDHGDYSNIVGAVHRAIRALALSPAPQGDASLINAARRYRDAVTSLGKFKDGKTLFEGSPTKDPECYDAWLELNNAGQALDAFLGKPPMNLMFSNEWLERTILKDKDRDEPEAGPDISEPLPSAPQGDVTTNADGFDVGFYQATLDLLLSGDEPVIRAALSNNLNTIISALRIAVASFASKPQRWAKSWAGRDNINLSGDAFVHVWQDKEWTIIHSRSGGAETTLSLNRHQAFDVAFALTPELLARFERARTAENALYTLKHPNADPVILRKLADEIDCGVDCELRRVGPCSKAEKDGMCGSQNAEDLRDFAEALERAALTAPQGEGRQARRWEARASFQCEINGPDVRLFEVFPVVECGNGWIKVRALAVSKDAQAEIIAALAGEGRQDGWQEKVADRVCRDVAELPNRTSPDDWPDAMLVTGEELHGLIVQALASAPAPQEGE